MSFFVYGTIHPKPSGLNRNRTFILERNHFSWAGYIPHSGSWYSRRSVGGLGLLVGYSTDLAVVNKLGAAKPAILAVAFGLLVCALVMACLDAGRCYVPGRRNKHDWGYAAMEAGAKEWSSRQGTRSENPQCHDDPPTKEQGTP